MGCAAEVVAAEIVLRRPRGRLSLAGAVRNLAATERGRAELAADPGTVPLLVRLCAALVTPTCEVIVIGMIDMIVIDM